MGGNPVLSLQVFYESKIISKIVLKTKQIFKMNKRNEVLLTPLLFLPVIPFFPALHSKII